MYGCYHPSRPIEQRSVAVDPNLLASDQDRERVVQLLSAHTAAGRLTLAEFEERVGTVYTARRVGELGPALADLPSVAQPARDQRVQWGNPFGSWLAVGLLCLVIWAVTSVATGRALHFWPVWVIGPWGFALLSSRHGRTRSRS